MRIGVLGAGQLGQMLALAGIPLGMKFSFFDEVGEAPAVELGRFTRGTYSDFTALKRFLNEVDVATFEFENVPYEAAEFVSKIVPLYPSKDALKVSQDRLVEKDFFSSLGIPSPKYASINSMDDKVRALSIAGLPAIIKTRRMGYDGKGQSVITEESEFDKAVLGLGGRDLILEEKVNFSRELSIIAVRTRGGDLAFYPLIENSHQGGILRESRAPASDVASIESSAQEIARAVLAKLDYVGVLAIELFDMGGRLLANEMAPRVHNSGHWTIEGAKVSQFENHIRAISGLPLGSTKARGFSIMRNLIGEVGDIEPLLKREDVHVHIYGKEPRPGRKLGHVTSVDR